MSEKRKRDTKGDLTASRKILKRTGEINTALHKSERTLEESTNSSVDQKQQVMSYNGYEESNNEQEQRGDQSQKKISKSSQITTKIGVVKSPKSSHYGKIWKASFDVDKKMMKDSFEIINETPKEFFEHCIQLKRTSKSEKNPNRVYTIMQDAHTGLDVEGTFKWVTSESS